MSLMECQQTCKCRFACRKPTTGKWNEANGKGDSYTYIRTPGLLYKPNVCVRQTTNMHLQIALVKGNVTLRLWWLGHKGKPHICIYRHG